MSERLTLIVGEYTISQLRSGEAVEFDNGVTILPASDLATNDPLRAHVAKLEAALAEISEREPWKGRKNYSSGDEGLADYWSDMAKEFQAAARAALKDAPQ